MAQSAAHLVDHVLPDVPVRQWVLTMPWRLRFLLATDPDLLRAVRRRFLSALFASYRSRGARLGLAGRPSAVHTGAVNVVQRFGSALNLNVHALVLDGVYVAESPLARPVFCRLPPLTDDEVARVLESTQRRIVRLLRARGLWGPSQEDPDAQESAHQACLPFLCAASIQGHGALGVAAVGRPDREQGGSGSDPGRLCAAADGFSLHARVRVESGDRERLEHLCRYVARPPIATERLSLSEDPALLSEDGQQRVVYELRYPWRDGTTHVSFDPLTFIARLAALVPHPREHLLTYHGVLAPAASWRDAIVPGYTPPIHPPSDPRDADEEPAPSGSSSRYSWSELLERVFAVDVLRCPFCGGRRRLIAQLTELAVVRRILRHLGLPSEPVEQAPARSPPQGLLGF